MGITWRAHCWAHLRVSGSEGPVRGLGICISKEFQVGTSPVAQWLRICLPMQGTRVRALVREDPTCRGATKPMHHNYWTRVPKAWALQQENPPQWMRSLRAATKTQHSQKKTWFMPFPGLSHKNLPFSLLLSSAAKRQGPRGGLWGPEGQLQEGGSLGSWTTMWKAAHRVPTLNCYMKGE